MSRKKLEFKTEWFSIESESINHIRSFKGKPFYRIVLPIGVLILATRKDGKIILIRQYRPSIKAYTLELPAGQKDKNESPQKAAMRELYEETGYVCKKFNFLCVGMPWIDRAKGRVYIFYGQGAVKKKGFRSKEKIQVVPVSFKELRQFVFKKRIQQLQLFAAIFMAKIKFGLEI